MYSNDIIRTKTLTYAWKKHKIKRKKYLVKGLCRINIRVCFFLTSGKESKEKTKLYSGG